MPVTFGSIGDIIAVGILVKDLVAALNQSRGSQAEYKQLVDELNLLGDVLARIDHLCNTAGTTTGRGFEVSTLHDATLQIAQNCRKCIEGFSVRLNRYVKTLGTSGVRTKSEAFKAVAANIRWQLGEKEDVVRFRAEIASQTASLNLALGATTWSVGKDSQDIMVKFEDDTGNHLQAQHEALTKVSNAVTETNTLISRMNTLSGQIVNGLATIGDLCTQAKTTMSKILFINVATYKMVLALKTSLPGYLERSLYSEPFILEDAIGRISPVHLQFISSWEALDAVLETRFRGLQGHDKVQSGLWTLQDHATGREISRRRNWEGAFLPGQKINMSLLFQREITVESFGPSTEAPTSNRAACPRCQADVLDSADVETQCDTCGLCFRRIVEIEEVDPKPTPPAPKPWLDKPTFGTASFKPTFGPQPVKLKRRRDEDDFDITGFKRIQILSKESRVRRHVFHPMPRKAPGPYSNQPQVSDVDNPSSTPDGPDLVRPMSKPGVHTLLNSSSGPWQPTAGSWRDRRDSIDTGVVKIDADVYNRATKAVMAHSAANSHYVLPMDLDGEAERKIMFQEGLRRTAATDMDWIGSEGQSDYLGVPLEYPHPMSRHWLEPTPMGPLIYSDYRPLPPHYMSDLADEGTQRKCPMPGCHFGVVLDRDDWAFHVETCHIQDRNAFRHEFTRVTDHE